MAENVKSGFFKETKVLEFWRRRYLGQAAIVFFIAAIIIGCGVWLIEFFLSLALLVLAVAVVVHVMLRELRDDLQVRGEGLIFNRKGERFEGAVFNVGTELDEKELLAIEGIKAYQVRECLSVMSGEGFVLEEEMLYTPVSAKFLAIKQVNFEGIAARFSAEGMKDTAGKLRVKRGRVSVFSGELKREAAEAFGGLLSLFGAEEALFYCVSGKFYLLIPTKQKLFFQFSLWRVNALGAFAARIDALMKAVDEAKRALKVDKA